MLRGILLQLVVFTAIPFLYWLFKRRKQTGFFSYVGLIRPRKTAPLANILLFAASYMIVYGLVHFVPFIAALTQPSASAYTTLSVGTLVIGLLTCFVQQALAEEVLFRGFIGKRFIARAGFAWGNLLQAMVFGAVHVLLSISSERNMVSYLLIFASITAGGWLLGYVNEKLFGGSILPSVLLHGTGNFIMILSVMLRPLWA